MRIPRNDDPETLGANPREACKNRYHNDIKLDSPEAVGAELRQWLSQEYTLGG